VVEKLCGIGLRIRGNMSRERPEGDSGKFHDPVSPQWNHAHFKLDFSEFASAKTNFHDLGGLNLKWFKDDGNYVREIYCYNLFMKFGVWTAPRVAYCRLFIKVEGDPKPAYFGIYTMIEPFDKYYLKARFTDPSMGENGYLWKCLWGATLAKAGKNVMGIESINLTNKSLSIKPPYDLKTKKADIENAKARLFDFIVNLNTKTGDDFKNWIVDAMDVDQLLRLYAVNVLVGMWDDYWKNQGNNYYLYFDEKGRAYFIPYDYDNTLGIGIQNFGNMGTEHVIKWGPSPKPVLMNKILAVPEFKAKYKQYLAELISPTNDLFDFTCSTNRIIKWQTMISPYISNDTGQGMVIVDRPTSSWSAHNYFKLLFGDATGKFPFANYFKTRIVFAQLQLGIPTNGNVWMENKKINSADVTPPKFLDAGLMAVKSDSPFISDIPIKTDEDGVIYYVVLPAKSPAPSMEQIKAGKDGNGAPALMKKSLMVDAGKQNLAMIHGTAAKTDYSLYIIAIDWSQNVQKTPTVIRFTTPALAFISPQDNGDTLTFRFQSSKTNTVYMKGEFNKWSLKTPLTKVSADIWEVTLPKSGLKKDSYYMYNVFPFGRDDWYIDSMNPSNYVHMNGVISRIWW